MVFVFNSESILFKFVRISMVVFSIGFGSFCICLKSVHFIKKKGEFFAAALMFFFLGQKMFRLVLHQRNL